jgi:hypothetical protein
MLFNLSASSYVEAIWFVSWKDADWMASLHRDEPDAPWQASYRFRYYATSDEAWDHRDTKNWYRAEMEGTEANRQKAFEAFETMSKLIASSKHGKRWTLLIRGGEDEVARQLSKQPWCHIKVSPRPPEGPQ